VFGSSVWVTLTVFTLAFN